MLATLNDIAPRDPVAHRQRRDRRLESRTERALGHLARQLAARMLTAARAARPMTLVLGDLDRDHWQLLDLPAHRLAGGHTLLHGEDMTAATAIGPMLDHPVYRPRRQKRPAPAPMPRLGTLFAP